MYYVYILKDRNTKKLYYGYSTDLKRRMEEHKSMNKNNELIYYEAYKAKKDAAIREKRIKQYAQALTSLKARLKESLK